jgi:hypothetical protein
MATLLERLEKSDLGQQLLADEQAGLLAHRGQLVREIADLEAAHLAALPTLQEAAAKAAAKLERAREALKPLEVAAGEAALARMSAANTFDSRRAPLEGELRSTASPTIDAFIKELGSLHERVRKEEPSSPSLRPFAAFPDPDDARRADEANARWTGRVARIRSAIAMAQDLKMLALSADELDARLGELRQSVSARGR